jgi:hypothetical protein
MFKNRRGTGPAPLGKQWHTGRVDIRKGVAGTAPSRGSVQPRLVAGVACLIVTFENDCFFSGTGLWA